MVKGHLSDGKDNQRSRRYLATDMELVARMDVIVRRGRLLDRPGLWDVGVSGHSIATVAPSIEVTAPLEADARGNLIAPTYVNAHVHLDKCNLGDVMRPNETNSFQECLEITWEHKRTYTVGRHCRAGEPCYRGRHSKRNDSISRLRGR